MILNILLVLIFILFDIYMPVSLAVTAAVMLSWLNSGWKRWAWVFGVGIAAGLLEVLPLGPLSLYLLLIAFLIYVLRQQFGQSRWWMTVVVGGVGELVYSLVWEQHINYGSIFGQIILLVIGFVLLQAFSHREGVYLKN